MQQKDVRELLHLSIDGPTIAQGELDAAHGRVRHVVAHDAGIIGIVEDARVYRTEVIITAFDQQAATGQALIGMCSCAKGDLCRHLAATVLQWLATRTKATETVTRAVTPSPPSPTPDETRPAATPAQPSADDAPLPPQITDNMQRAKQSELSTWMHDVLEQQRAATVATSEGQRLLYVLSFEELHGFPCRAVTTRRLKNGKEGISRKFRDFAQLRSDLPAAAEAQDFDIICQLAALESVYRFSHYIHHRDRSSLPLTLLEQIIATGRAHWDDHLGALVTNGPPLALQAHWHRSKNDWECRLSISSATPTAVHQQVQFVPTTPPCVRVDNAVHRIDETQGLNRAAIAALTQMPKASSEDLAAIAEPLRTLVPNVRLPEAIPAASEPVPVLHWLKQQVSPVADAANDEDFSYSPFSKRRRATRASPPVRASEWHVARLGFRYGTHEVSALAQQLVIPIASGERIVRNIGREQARRDELTRFGLLPVDGTLVAHVSHLRGAALITTTADALGALPGPPTPAVVAALRASGWDIRGLTVDAVQVHALADVSATVSEAPRGDWFEVNLGMQIGERRIDLVPLLTTLLRDGPQAWQRLPLAAGDPPSVLVTADATTVISVPLNVLGELHDRLIELFSREPGPGGGWRIDPFQADLIEGLDRLSPLWLGAERLKSLAKRWASCREPPVVAVPTALHAELRPYQVEGLSWLQHLRGLGVGGILADDMGLGKTVQAIAHLVCEYVSPRADRPSIVVCPASMVGTWLQSLARFAPLLRARRWHGQGRKEQPLGDAQVVVTTYATLVQDQELLGATAWHVAIADEAQAFKNHQTKTALAMRALDARQRLCLSGTPVENHLGELHALLSWAAPGALGGGSAFDTTFRTPIEDKADDAEARRALLRRRVTPFMLRRTKDAVAKDLPPRSETDIPIELSAKERAIYESIRLTVDERVRAAIAERGLARSGMLIIEALLRLRQAACHPGLLPSDLAKGVRISAKMEALRELLATLIDEGRQVLVFSQFTSLLDLVEADVLAPSSITFLRIDGSTSDRQGIVERFQAGAASVLLLSLKAGGTGLTLTAADTVVLLDPWWNPAVERQAADRAHRIGQTKPVQIFRLIAQGTVEERIRALHAHKRDLASAITDDSGQSLGRLSAEDLSALLAPME